jgi:hypothetical protein
MVIGLEHLHRLFLPHRWLYLLLALNLSYSFCIYFTSLVLQVVAFWSNILMANSLYLVDILLLHASF